MPRSSGRRTIPRAGARTCAGLGVAVLAGLTGCAYNLHEIPPTQASTTGVIAALVLSPQNEGLQEHRPGYLVLVHADGSSQSIRTAGMDIGKIDWDSHGIFTTDYQKDYWLNGRLTTQKSPKSSQQIAAHRDPSTGAVIGLYNYGFTEGDRYTEELVESTPTSSTKSTVEGLYQVTAWCNGRVIAIGQRTGPYLPPAAQERIRTGNGTPGLMLAQLYPLTDGHEHVIASVDSPSEGTPRGPARCTYRDLAYVADLTGPDGFGAGSKVARTWNLSTGALTEVPLTDENGKPLELATDEISRSVNLPELSTTDIVWLSNNGILRRTNPETGRTTRIADLHTRPGITLNAIVDDDGHIVVIEDPDDPGMLRLRVFNPETGTEISSLDLPGLRDKLSVDLVLRDFAVRPNDYRE